MDAACEFCDFYEVNEGTNPCNYVLPNVSW